MVIAKDEGCAWEQYSFPLPSHHVHRGAEQQFSTMVCEDQVNLLLQLCGRSEVGRLEESCWYGHVETQAQLLDGS